MKKFKIKKGDTVIVIAGKEKGKEAKVLQVLRNSDRVVLDGVNLMKKHLKPKYTGKSGQIVEKPQPIHISNVQIKDPKTNKPTRVRFEYKKDKKLRVAVKSGSELK